jgi:hypothetical protein
MGRLLSRAPAAGSRGTINALVVLAAMLRSLCQPQANAMFGTIKPGLPFCNWQGTTASTAVFKAS